VTRFYDAPRDRLRLAFSASVVEALEELVEMIIGEHTDPLGHRPEWVTMAEAARRLECSVDAVRMRVKRGRLRARRQGRRVYVSTQDVDGIA
jgi:excisionase family DNA binding protein